ncbi:hypothetical protein [Candidatus Similichlamydia laticola]|uniref:Uncharacterized protein n=1 Tax=Candidatus Similichlamydia laticola TaxID=2170265 RepID=A0A369KB68_9BACT|nr:hypothetical protein [Candidatus Similichlamydia laticola]RDB31158.1 hypothetical protein HAT2_00740 [Candidatus Similichlamydia laticola]
MLKEVGATTKQLVLELGKSLVASFKTKKKASVLILPMGEKVDLLCLSEKSRLLFSFERGKLHIIEPNKQLMGPLAEKGLKTWLSWLEEEFDLSLIGGGPDQMVIVRGLHLELIQRFAIHQVLPFKLEQYLPMPLAEMHIGYLIQKRDVSGSWATIHICSHAQLEEFLISCSDLCGHKLDLFYPQSLLLFQALQQERPEETFVFLHRMDKYSISFLAHQGKLLAVKAMKDDQGDLQTLIKHFEKLAGELDQDRVSLIILEKRDNFVLSNFWKVEQLNRSIYDYFFLGLSAVQDPELSSSSVNLLSKVDPDSLNRLDKNWMRTVLSMFLCFSCTILALAFFVTSKQRTNAMHLYKTLQDKMEMHAIEELDRPPSSLQEAYQNVFSLIRKGEEYHFETNFFSYPSLERLAAWICLETYPQNDFKQKPFVRLTKFSYSVEDRSRPVFSFSFVGKSERDLELFRKQVVANFPAKYFSSIAWDMNQLDGSCDCLLMNQADDVL